MRNDSFVLKFFLAPNKKHLDGQNPIYLRIIVNRKKAEISTKQIISTEEDWDSAAQRLRYKSPINTELSKIEGQIANLYYELKQSKTQITATLLKSQFLGRDQSAITLKEFIDTTVQERIIQSTDLAPATIQNYVTTFAHLESFLEEARLKNINLKELDENFVKRFDSFLLKKNLVNSIVKTLNRNTVNKYHTKMKAILNLAVEEGLIVKSPYSKFKMKKQESKRTFLTKPELDKIEAHDLGGNQSLQRTRDKFLFSVYTGLRFTDADNLKSGNVEFDGSKYWINFRQQKTNELLRIPMLGKAREIYDKYASERSVSGFVLPRLTNQKVNAYLKIIADTVGITKPLTHHVAKVRKVTRDAAAMLLTGTGAGSITKADIEYEYNGMRQRVTKIVKPRDQATKQLKPSTEWIYTYYTYDASGNTVAVYDRTISLINSGNAYKDDISLAEEDIYGSKRLAIKRPVDPVDWFYTYAVCGGDPSTCRTFPSPATPPGSPPPGTYSTSRSLGYKEFELDNHLGNVIATVSDRKVVTTLCPNQFLRTFNDGNMANIVAVGANLNIVNNMLQVSPFRVNGGVTFNYPVEAGQEYLIGFDIDFGNVSINSGFTAKAYSYNETTGEYGGNTVSIPITGSGHYDLDYTELGLTNGFTQISFDFSTYSGTPPSFNLDNFAVAAKPVGPPTPVSTPCSLYVTLFNGYFPDLLMHTDYYAFGQQMPGRTWTYSDYRYAFNGKEKSSEINSGDYDFGERILDARIGRWLTWDQLRKKYPFASPYNFSLDNPLSFIDPDGKVVTPADNRATVLYNNLKIALQNSTDEKSKMMLCQMETLEKNPEVNYVIHAESEIPFHEGDAGSSYLGVTRVDYENSTEGNTTVHIFINIRNTSSQAYGALGDEITSAYQFDQGDVGFRENYTDPNGKPKDQNPNGSFSYDSKDEYKTKVGSVIAIDAMNNLEGGYIYGPDEQMVSDLEKQNLPEDKKNEQIDKKMTSSFEQIGYEGFEQENGKPRSANNAKSASEDRKNMDNSLNNSKKIIYRAKNANGNMETKIEKPR